LIALRKARSTAPPETSRHVKNGWRSANLWPEHSAEEFVSKDAQAADARAEVARAVSGRMGQLGVSAAELRRRSGLSVNTIRGITEGTRRHNRSTWVAISAALEWPWDYLVNILNGSADKNATAKSPMETQLAKLAGGLADIDVLRQDISVLADIVHEIDRKIDVVITRPRP
jgi:hypothetical protein